MSFGCKDGISALREISTTATNIRSHSRHPLFPQVDPSTFDNLAERGRTHVTDNYANNKMTATTTHVGMTMTTTRLDKSCKLFWSMQPPENPCNTPYCNTPYRRSATQFAPAAAGQAHQMEDVDEEEEEASLGGQIVSPQNTDRWRQTFAKKISPLDVA